MDKHRIKSLIQGFNDNKLDSKEFKELEKLIEDGVINIRDLKSLNEIYETLDKIDTPEPDKNLDLSFYTMLEEARVKQRSGFWFQLNKFFTFPEKRSMILRPVLSIVLLLIGFISGNYFSFYGNQQKLDEITAELQKVQSLMMLNLLEKPSASERLKAIQISHTFETPNEKMIDALLTTLNSDDNPNIRLAAIEALTRYADNEKVRTGLVESISRQDLPIVQVALVDVMVRIQEKRAVEKLKILMEKEGILMPVKEKINESIKKLI